MTPNASIPSELQGKPAFTYPTAAGSQETYGEGDTHMVYNLLLPGLAETAFEKVRGEVQWMTMTHRGGEVPRLVAVEGVVDEDGSFPIYRHPADESPPLRSFSPTVALIRNQVRAMLGEDCNHVLIQLYRSGADYISEHSDKTVDVAPGTHIVNVSLGAQRTMTLRTKKDAMSPPPTTLSSSPSSSGVSKRAKQRIPLPHNSALIMGLATNARWLHAVRTDNRLPVTKTPAELASGGERISLTFRTIGSFIVPGDPPRIWGQGARAKTRAEARPVVRDAAEAERLLAAFGRENHASDFDWGKWYGEGFDVVDFRPAVA